MGRYYNGDIEGKFWFGVQNSNAASQFGGEECEPRYIEYYFDESHLDEAEKQLEVIKNRLGEYKEKLDKFFENLEGYNEKMLIEAGFPVDMIKTILIDYADIELGEKIIKCIKENGSCSFEAEL